MKNLEYATEAQRNCTNVACAKASYSGPQIEEAIEMAMRTARQPPNRYELKRRVAAVLNSHNCLLCTPRKKHKVLA